MALNLSAPRSGAVLAAALELEAKVSAFGDEVAVYAWAVTPDAGTVDPHGGQTTHGGAIAAALDQLRAATEGIAAGEERPTPVQSERAIARVVPGRWN